MGRLQIMFMSMGEPLLNLKNLIPALRELYALYPKAALLISTSMPKISNTEYLELIKVSKEIPTIGLQFLVHESTDEERDKLIPFKKKLSLREISSFGLWWKISTNRKPFFNYCAHDKNSSDINADEILDLFDPEIFCATVSVICERTDGMAATNQYQRDLAVDFAAKLVDRGYDVRVFDPAGQDTIGGGCGQLHFVQRWFTDNPNKTKKSIGFGKEEIHTPRKELK